MPVVLSTHFDSKKNSPTDPQGEEVVLSENVSPSVVSDSLQSHRLAHQVPPSMEFSKQENWSGLPFSSKGSSRPRD